jgi:hypothetical protein
VNNKNYKNHFYTSTSLESDLKDKRLIQSVIVTNPLIKTVSAINQAVRGIYAKNASLSVVGPYGSGKSTSILIAYHYLKNTLPKNLRSQLSELGLVPIKKPFKDGEILVITGKKVSLVEHLKQKLKTRNIDGLIEKKILQGKRLVLIIDEFGKYLEYNADNQQNGDVYILQQLAELAQRSEGKFTLITIRHQAIKAYFSSIRLSYLNEWKKIQGRFSDIVHTTNLSETLSILSQSINERITKQFSVLPKKEIIDCFKKNNFISLTEIDNYLLQSYPLHPFTALFLITGFKKFAQNERSIFTFLDSNEKGSLNNWLANNRNQKILFTLSDYYDYIDKNMKFAIYESDISSDWHMIENSLNSLKNISSSFAEKEFSFAIEIIKSIGLIQLFGKDIGLYSSKRVLNLAISSKSLLNKNKINRLIHLLHNKNIISYRKLYDSFILWEGTDLNVNDLIEEKIAELPKSAKISSFVRKYFPVNPIIAQKHLVETGTLRWTEFQFCEIDEILENITSEADGIFRCILVKNYNQKNQIERFINDNLKDLPKNVFPIVLMIGNNAETDLKTLISINELLTYNNDIAKDKIARKELKMIHREYNYLLKNLFVDKNRYNTKLYYWKESKLILSKWRNLNLELSKKFDSIYDKTPIIHNELINKEKPSPSANFGIKQLLKHLNEDFQKHNLGIEKSGPEKSIYLNVLRKTGLHRMDENGEFGICKPSEDKSLICLWDKWDKLIRQNTEKKVCLSELINLAKDSPFGIKEGLAKFLAIVKVFEKLNHISLYKEDNEVRGDIFISEIKDDTIEHLLYNPNTFFIHYVLTEKIHQNLFKELYRLIKKESKSFITLLDAVKPLIKFVNRLSYYTKSTQSQPEPFHNVIQCIERSVSPEELIYQEIPVALGINQITNKTDSSKLDLYIKLLKKWHKNVHEFEENMLLKLHESFRAHWEIQPHGPRDDFETTSNYLITQISPEVSKLIVDNQLKEFVNRAIIVPDGEKLSYIQWFESLVSSIAGSRPQNWNDDDHKLFIERICNYRIRMDEAIEWARKKSFKTKYLSEKNKKLSNKILDLLDSESVNLNSKIVALLNAQEELEKKLKKKNNA